MRDLPKRVPIWLAYKIDRDLIGKPYLDYLSPGQPNTDPNAGFDCWGWCWYYAALYLNFEGLELWPKDAYEAEKNSEIVIRPQFLDVASCSEDDNPVPHCGIMEDQYWMLHCSITTGGVARACVLDDYWRTKLTFHRYVKFNCSYASSL